MKTCRTISVLSMTLFLSCASSSVRKLEEMQSETIDLPVAVVEKFEVKEIEEKESLEAATKKKASVKKENKKKTKEAVVLSVKQEKKQSPYQVPETFPFSEGERMRLEVQFFGATAGEIDFKVMPSKMVSDQKVFHFRGEGRSTKIFSLFYRVEDYLESFWTKSGLYPVRTHLVVDETKQTREALELFDPIRGKVFYSNKHDHYKKGYKEEKVELDYPPYAQDGLSGIYYIRTLDFKKNKKFHFPAITQSKLWEMEVYLEQREKISTALGKKDVLKLRMISRQNGEIKDRGENYIWMSDDDQRIILRFDVKVKVGTITGVLTEYEPGKSESTP